MHKRILTSVAFIVFAIPAVAEAQDSSFFVGTWDRSARYGPSMIVFYNNGYGYFIEDGDRYSFSWRLAGRDSRGDPFARLELLGSGPSGIAREVYWAEISGNYRGWKAIALRYAPSKAYYGFVRR
jgi:hypothetical protein